MEPIASTSKLTNERMSRMKGSKKGKEVSLLSNSRALPAQEDVSLLCPVFS